MKTNTTFKKQVWLILIAALVLATGAGAQSCLPSVPGATFFGLRTTGCIYPINTTTGAVGIRLDSLTVPNTGENANGLGFNSVNKKFYYFHRSGTTAVPVTPGPPQQFVAYDPVLHTLTALAVPPASLTAGHKIRSGCVNDAGTGYYTINPNGAAPILYYYNIAANTWTTIGQVFMKAGPVDVSATFKSLNSGDMTFDGSGNLWILLSGGPNQYALYKIANPVPTTAVTPINVIEVTPPTPNPGGGNNLTGFAFDPSGIGYLTTGILDDKIYKMTTASAALTLVTTFAMNDIGADITSCNYPLYVLPVKWENFTAELASGVNLSWSVFENYAVKGYAIEKSANGKDWEKIDFVRSTKQAGDKEVTYTYTDGHHTGQHAYYRIVQESINGEKSISDVKQVSSLLSGEIKISPNPARDIIYVHSQMSLINANASILDANGVLIQTKEVTCSNPSFDISQLKRGNYILRLVSSQHAIISNQRFIKL